MELHSHAGALSRSGPGAYDKWHFRPANLGGGGVRRCSSLKQLVMKLYFTVFAGFELFSRGQIRDPDSAFGKLSQ